MELPIARESYRPSIDVLVRALKRADVITARMTATETQLPGALAFTNADRPDVHMANFACELSVPDAMSADEVVAGVDDHFQQAGARCHWLVANERDWPDDLARAAEARGYQPSEPSTVYLLDKHRQPTETSGHVQIIPARAAYPALRQFLREAAIDEYHVNPELADHLADTHLDHLDEPRLELFLGRIDGRSAGLGGLVTLGNIGVIYWLYTAPAFRRRGVGRALMQHTLDLGARSLFESILLEACDDAPAVRLYQSLGFEPIARQIKYVRPAST